MGITSEELYEEGYACCLGSPTVSGCPSGARPALVQGPDLLPSVESTTLTLTVTFLKHPHSLSRPEAFRMFSAVEPRLPQGPGDPPARVPSVDTSLGALPALRGGEGVRLLFLLQRAGFSGPSSVSAPGCISTHRILVSSLGIPEFPPFHHSIRLPTSPRMSFRSTRRIQYCLDACHTSTSLQKGYLM